MIGFISVTIAKGELVDREQLRALAKQMYPDEASPEGVNHTSDVQKYVSDLPSVYTCIPRNASRATFVWQDAQAFEIVLEATLGGSLIAVVEGLARRLSQRLEQLGLNAEIHISLRGSSDWSTYVAGEPIGKAAHAWRAIRETVIALMIAVILLGISNVWLTQYQQEAVASVITLILLLGWRLYAMDREASRRGVYWTVNTNVD